MNQEKNGDSTGELRDKAKKIEKLMPYTGGDMDLAVKILNGAEHDVYILKGKFKIPDQGRYGIFIVFINKFRRNIKFAAAASTASQDSYRTKLSLPWVQYLKEVNRIRASSENLTEVSSLVEQLFHVSLKIQHILNIINYVDRSEYSNLDATLNPIFAEHFASRYLELHVDKDLTDSLKTEEAGIEDENLIQDIKKREKKKGAEKESNLPPEIQTMMDQSVEGSPVISAVTGKSIQKIESGDEIKVRITDTSERGRNLQKVFQSENESGAILPLKAKVRHIARQEDGRWLILADLGGKTYLRIIEELESIKISLWEDKPVAPNPGQGKIQKQILILALIISVLSIATGLILIFL